MGIRKKTFLVLLLLIQVGLIRPIASFFSGIYPMVLGLPLSFAWVVAMLISAFFLLRPFPMHEGIYALIINIILITAVSLATKPEPEGYVKKYRAA